MLGLAASGATRNALTKGMIENFVIPCPPIDVQRHIGKTLMALERRVESLQAIDQSLEAVARAIFKSWFVDFDPVRAKAEGREPDGMDAATAALFPSTFLEDGSAPEGWSITTLGAVTKRITKGTTPTTLKRAYVESGINFIKAESLTDAGFLATTKFSFIDVDTHELLKRSQLQASDVLVTIAGTIGRVAEVTSSVLPANTNQAVAIVRPDAALAPASLIKRFLRLLETQRELGNQTVQAVQANVSLGVLSALRLVLPPPHVAKCLSALVLEPIDRRVEANAMQARTLTELRDALLPRLISGKLRVLEAEKMVEAVL